jgi:lysozyme
MNLSERGFEKIKAYEGYHTALPDGSCTAYQENINGKLDIPTIGYGCTKGVTMGMVWTKEQAEAALKEEIAIHEARVRRLVTVDLNQNQFDALVSFDYNTGGLTLAGGVPSGVLKAVNNGGDVAAELMRWTKFKGAPVKGLVSRRADEVSLYLEPVGDVPADYMPQAPEQAAQPVSKGLLGVLAATAGSTATTAATVDFGLIASKATEVKAAGDAVSALGGLLMSSQMWLAACVGGICYAALTYGPKLLGRSA